MNAPGDFKGGITKNFEGLIFAENEVGYEVGYLAGADGAEGSATTTVSSVGGIPVPAVVRYIAGFQAGAKKAVPSITVLNGYSQDFVAQDKCKNIALDQISKGSTSCSRSPAAAASARSTRRRRRASGASASTPTSPTSTTACSRAPRRRSTSAVYTAIAEPAEGQVRGRHEPAVQRRERRRRPRQDQQGRPGVASRAEDAGGRRCRWRTARSRRRRSARRTRTARRNLRRGGPRARPCTFSAVRRPA